MRIGGDGVRDSRAGSRSADMSAGQDSREDSASRSESESESESESDERGQARRSAPIRAPSTGTSSPRLCFNCGGDHLVRECPEPLDETRIKDAFKEWKDARRIPRVARVAGARFVNATGAVSRDATPAKRSAESLERESRMARAAAAEAAAARAAAAAVAAAQPTLQELARKRLVELQELLDEEGEAFIREEVQKFLMSEKNDEKSADTDTRAPEIYPTQAESSDSRDGAAEVRERLIRAVTAILNPLKNPPPLQEHCVVTLHTLCKNVIDHPNDDRYRLVKATSRTMTQKVLRCVGGEQFLYAAGWTKVTVNYEGYYRCDTAAVSSATLRCAEDVLSKNLTLCRDKAARHERLKTKEKDDAARQKQELRRAIEEDKARRREAEERKRAAKASGASM